MSEEMAPSWRSLASAASRSIKGYIAQQRELKQGYPASRGPPPPGSELPKRQTWGQWAGQKLRRGSQSEYDTSGDRLALFPGWAARRYREHPTSHDDGEHTAAAALSPAPNCVFADACVWWQIPPLTSMYSSLVSRRD